jgi:hypothetical protein
VLGRTLEELTRSHHLASKIAAEPNLAAIMTEFVTRLIDAYGSLPAIRGQAILDIACGSSSSRSPVTGRPTSEFEPAEAAAEAQSDAGPPLGDFVAHAADCRVYGRVALETGRLSDLLNAHEEYELIDVELESLADGQVVHEPVVLVARDEVIAVHASGRPGPRSKRTNTRAWPIVIQSEPYLIWGHLHVLPGADPIASFRHRKPMIPLTDASIEYVSAGQPQRVALGTVVVNRELTDWFRLAVVEDADPPEVPAGEVGPLTKDFTDQVLRAWND